MTVTATLRNDNELKDVEIMQRKVTEHFDCHEKTSMLFISVGLWDNKT